MREPTVHRDNYVCVYNKTRGRPVATHARVADGFVSRLVGLLGTRRQDVRAAAGLWIVPSRGVHTLGMAYPLDLIFLNRQNVVVDVEEQVRPFRISKIRFKACSVLELPAPALAQSETQVGDQLEITQAPAHRPVVPA